MKEGTDDVDAQQQHLHLTVSKGWIAALVDIETLKTFVSTRRVVGYVQVPR
jgi:hypothetical protein